VISIGSGGGFALAAAKGMLSVPDVALDIEVIAKRSLEIAAQMCIYTNDQIIIETLS
jgi:ATP-dependent HslUV protease subunit HslV